MFNLVKVVRMIRWFRENTALTYREIDVELGLIERTFWSAYRINRRTKNWAV